MKITDPEVIKTGEKDLIASVHEDLDLEAVTKILKSRMSKAALAPRGGRIVVHDNDIAFRLDFEMNLSGSLLFDRDGNFIDAQDDGPKEMAGDGADLEAAMDLDLDDDDLGLTGTEDTDTPVSGPVDDGLTTDDLSTDDLSLSTDDLSTDDLSIGLPDYDLDDDSDEALDPDEDLEIGDLEEDDELLLDTGDGLDLGTDDPLEEEIKEDGPKDLDDDISDILKENRDFWEQKKES